MAFNDDDGDGDYADDDDDDGDDDVDADDCDGDGDGGDGDGDDGDELASPPILYSPNNSDTCGVRPSSSGGVRLAINSSGGEGGAAPGGVPAHRLGPKPWAGGGEVRLIDNSAGVSRIKISPSSGSSYSRSPARVSIGSFALSSPAKEM